MASFENNNGVLTPISTNVKFRNMSQEEFVTEEELEQRLEEKQDVIQYSTLPTASEDNLGKIYQYVGVDTSDYKNGMFYKCISDGATTPTYSYTEYNPKNPNNTETYYAILQNAIFNLANELSFNAPNGTTYLEMYVDDANSDLSDIWDVAQEYNIPLNISVPTNRLYEIANNGQKIVDLLHDMENAGCEIHSHSINYSPLTSETTRAEAIAMLRDSKAALEREGFTVNGFIHPGGTEAIPWSESPFGELVRRFYKYSDCGIFPRGLNIGRTSLTNGVNINSLLNAVKRSDPCRKFFFHSFSSDFTEANFRAFVEEAISRGYIFTTRKEYYNNYTYSILNDRIIKLERIYGKYTTLDHELFIRGLGQPPIENAEIYKYWVYMYVGGLPTLYTFNSEIITYLDTNNHYRFKMSDDSTFGYKRYCREDSVWSKDAESDSASSINSYTGNINFTNFDLYDDNGVIVSSVEYYYTY